MTLLETAPHPNPAPAPGRDAASRWQRLRGPAIAAAAIGAATLALHLRDPHRHGSWGECPLAALGLYCPACGGLRAVNDLTGGHVAAAASSNLLLVLALPFAAVAFGLWTSARWTGRPRRAIALPPPAGRALPWVLAVVVVGFAVARNLPGSWLAP